MSNSCIGRGGEVKFQDYSEWTYHPLLEVTGSSWTETKTLHCYPMPMVPEKLSWEYDFYHMLGTYYSIKNGLHRSQDEINKGLLNSVFPDLHQYLDTGATKQMTSIIREKLPEGCPDKITKSLSIKSSWQGGITEFALHQRMPVFNACARSGHSTGVNLESYIDKNNIARGLPASRACTRWTDVDIDVKVARLESLGASISDQIDKLIMHLFVVTVPALLVGGESRSPLSVEDLRGINDHVPQTSHRRLWVVECNIYQTKKLGAVCRLHHTGT
jgi:hypothetical protein